MISVIIVSYNVELYLKQCIESILKSINSKFLEIIIIDNYSYDNSISMLKNNFKNIKIIENKKNIGFSSAANIGIKNSKGNYICLINPDSIIKEDTLDVLKKYLDNNSKVGIIGCKVLDPNGKLQLSSRRSFPTILSLIYKFFGLSKIFPKNKFFAKYNQTYVNDDKIQEVDSISGSCMMFKKNMIKEIGYLDEQFFLYFEDTDFCLRAINAGYKVIYNPNTQIIHYKNQSSKYAPFDVQDVFYQSLLKFYKKYKKQYSFSLVTNIIMKVFIYIRKSISHLFRYRKEIVISGLDTIAIIFSFIFSILFWYSYQYNQIFKQINVLKHWPLIFVYILTWYFSASFLKFYKKNGMSYGASILNSIISFFLTTTITYFLSFFAFSRAILLISSILVSILTGIWRIFIHYLLKYSQFNSAFIYHYLFARNAIILGCNNSTLKIRKKLLYKPNLNYNYIVFLDNRINTDYDKLIVGRLDDIKNIISKYKINEVIFPESNKNISSTIDFIQTNNIFKNVEFKFLSSNRKHIIGKGFIEDIDDMSLIKIEYVLFENLQKNIKRTFDIILAIILGSLLSPLLLYYLIFNKIENKYIWGLKGKKITIFKIKIDNNFISEFPLIYSVLKGDLSFVGTLLTDYNKSNPKSLIKPGITGLSKQKFNKNKLLIKAQDEYYIENYSLIFDIEILLKSLLKL